MATELAVINSLLDALAAGDVSAVLAHYSDDAEGIDEISRDWLRGKVHLAEYTGHLIEQISDLHSEFTHEHIANYGNVSLVTGLLHQHYTWDGERVDEEMPATIVLLRHQDSWLVRLFHALPIPD